MILRKLFFSILFQMVNCIFCNTTTEELFLFLICDHFCCINCCIANVNYELSTIYCCKVPTKIQRNGMQSIIRKKKILEIGIDDIKQEVSIRKKQSAIEQQIYKLCQKNSCQKQFNYENIKNQQNQYQSKLAKTQPYEFYQKRYQFDRSTPKMYQNLSPSNSSPKILERLTTFNSKVDANSKHQDLQNYEKPKKLLQRSPKQNKENYYIDRIESDQTFMQQSRKQNAKQIANQFRNISIGDYQHYQASQQKNQYPQVQLQQKNSKKNMMEIDNDNQLWQIFKNQLNRLKSQFSYVHKKLYGNEEQAIQNLLRIFQQQLRIHQNMEISSYGIPIQYELIQLSLKKYIDSLKIPLHYKRPLEQFRISRRTSQSRFIQTQRRNSQLWEKLNNQQSQLLQKLQKHYLQDRPNCYQDYLH